MRVRDERGYNNDNNHNNAGVYMTDTNYRKIFEEFATSRGFNPSVAHSWYSQKRDDMVSSKVCKLLIYTFYYGLIYFVMFSGDRQHCDKKFWQQHAQGTC